MERFTSRPFKRAFRRGLARATTAVALTAIFAVLLPLPALAGQWRQKEIKWHITSVGSPTNATAIYNRDTTYTVVATSQVDTTGSFSLTQADVFRGGHSGAATMVDTCLAGFLLIQGDSSTTIANTISGITVEIDGRAVGTGAASGNASWTVIDSTVASPIAAGSTTDGPTAVCIIPLRAMNALGGIGGSLNNGAAAGAVNQPYKIFACEELRVRLSPTAGLMSAARVFVRWWDED